MLAGLGYSLHVICPQSLSKDIEEFQSDTIRVHRIKQSRRLNSFVTALRILMYIIFNYDRSNTKIFYESGEYPVLALLLQFYYGAENVIMRIHGCFETEYFTWRGRLADRFGKKLMGLFLKRAQIIISTNSYHIEFIIEHYFKGNRLLAARKMFLTMPNVVSYEGNASKPEPVINDELQQLKSSKYFFSLGRMNGIDSLGQKGFIDILNAWLILENKSDPDLMPKLVLVGSGKYCDSLKLTAKKLGIEKSVLFIDAIPRALVAELLKNSAGCILPSRYEGFSMFAAEVVQSGGILIGTQKTGLVDLIVDEKTGFIIQPNSPLSIALVVNKILSMDEIDLLKMRRGASKHMEELCNPSNIKSIFDISIK